MNSCTQIREELKALADGELRGSARASVERHVASCVACREELGQIQRLGSALRTLDQALPRPELRARILAQLPAPAAPASRAPWWRVSGPQLALGAGLAGIVLIALILRSGPYAPPPEVEYRASGRTAAAPDSAVKPREKTASAPMGALPEPPRAAESQRKASGPAARSAMPPVLPPMEGTAAPSAPGAAPARAPKRMDRLALEAPSALPAPQEESERRQVASGAEMPAESARDSLGLAAPATAGGAGGLAFGGARGGLGGGAQKSDAAEQRIVLLVEDVKEAAPQVLAAAREERAEPVQARSAAAPGKALETAVPREAVLFLFVPQGRVEALRARLEAAFGSADAPQSQAKGAARLQTPLRRAGSQAGWAGGPPPQAPAERKEAETLQMRQRQAAGKASAPPSPDQVLRLHPQTENSAGYGTEADLGLFFAQTVPPGMQRVIVQLRQAPRPPAAPAARKKTP